MAKIKKRKSSEEKITKYLGERKTAGLVLKNKLSS